MASKGINRILLSFSCFILLMGPCYSETATLLQGQQLNYGEELVSANGLFRLGFFNPEFTNKSYLGIWYNSPKAALDPPEERAVWVANRNSPIFRDSGILTIDGTDGNLKISHDGGDPVVLTWVGGVSNNTSATLLDSGNLVLHEHNLDGSIKQVLWQSFDYPTDSFLPGMKLGIDLKTGLNRSLTSWRSNQSPASGSFTLGMDPNGTNQLVIWWRGDIFWTSGLWHNGRFGLSDLLAAEDDTVYNFSYISDENETYFKYSVNQDVVFFPKLRISEEGDLIDYYDRSALHCEPFSVNSSVGCVQKKLPECRISDSNYFVHHMGFMSGEGLIVSESDNFTLADCEAKCTYNCSCVAYASKNSDGTGCEYWSSKSGFKESTSDGWRDIYILKSKAKAKTWWIWLMVTIGGALIILLVCSSYFIWRECKAKGVQKRKQKLLLSELGGDIMASTIYDGVESHKKDENELHIFSFERIAAATNNFSTANKLGEGGYGPVYKGKLLDGREVAIKRLSRSSGQGLVEFKNEAILIAKLQHTNLVRLLGFCIQEEEKILIYEYMSNKSLDLFLFDSGKKNILNWKKRLGIIEGIVQGLIYLHKYSRLRVIHRDLKASNILLDDDMNPKISDFGMARIFGVDESQVNTNRVVGTYGYMSPEYAMNGIVSTKTDVFSFGVLLLEIVSNKKNNSYYQSGCALNLVGYAWQLWNEGRGLELIDPALGEFCSHNEFLRCIHVGLLCVQYHAIDRPTMSEVVSMLSNDTISLPIPKQPAFFIVKVVEELEVDNYSINHVSISEMDAR